MFEIRLAASQEELEQLYRFRYSIYVEEMQRVQHDADHANKRITDTLDECAFNLLAIKDGNLAGTARINFARYGAMPYYLDFYQIKEQEGCSNENSSIVTRLMISKNHRRSTLALRLCIASYEFGLWRGIRFNFIDCNDHLVNFFESFGYRHYIGTAKHKEYGEVHPLKLDLHDEALFRSINSPFLQPFLAWKNRAPSVAEEIYMPQNLSTETP